MVCMQGELWRQFEYETKELGKLQEFWQREAARERLQRTLYVNDILECLKHKKHNWRVIEICEQAKQWTSSAKPPIYHEIEKIPF
jgi:hypothetical protein